MPVDNGADRRARPVCLCLAAVAPLPAGYMLTGGNTWRLFFNVVLAFAVALFVLAFFFAEETSYDRKAALAAEAGAESPSPRLEEQKADMTAAHKEASRESVSTPPRKTYLQTLSITGRFDPSVPFFATMFRSFTYFLVPQALWVITTYGLYIGLGAFVFSFTFPLKIMGPPYNWDVVSVPHPLQGCRLAQTD